MNDVLSWFIDWWRRRRRNSARIDRVERYSSASVLPEHLNRHVVAIAGDPPAWAVMECPCGNGHRLKVRVRARDHATVWILDEGVDGPSLRPSIDFNSAERRCHFWLRNGRVTWVDD